MVTLNLSASMTTTTKEKLDWKMSVWMFKFIDFVSIYMQYYPKTIGNIQTNCGGKD